MTRQHFEAIAETLKALRPAAGPPRAMQTKARWAQWTQWADTVRAMTATLARFNAGFDAARFSRACGLEE